MIKRLFAILIIVLFLTGLIAYSKLRPASQHVSGFIEVDEIRLGSRVGGRVQEVLVEEGQTVEKGQVLVKLEPFDLTEQLTEAEATLAAREADLDRLQAGYRSEEVGQARSRHDQLQARLDKLVAGPRPQEIDAARARLEVAQAELRFATLNFNRVQGLVNTNAITREELDRATESLEAAKATVNLRQEELNLYEVGTREEEIREARAMVEEARLAWELAKNGFRKEEVDAAKAARDSAAAAVEAIRARIDELTIKSPVAGSVEALELEPGDLVSASAPMMSVLDNSHYWVRTYVPQKWMNLKLGQEVSVTVDGQPGKKYAATITFISRQAEFTPSNVQTPEERGKQVFRIKATLKEGLEELRPGISADVWLDEVPAAANQSTAVISRSPFNAEDQNLLKNIVPALDLYRAEHGEYPRSHEEFMEKVVNSNQLTLPELKPGLEYIYDPDDHLLKVYRPVAEDKNPNDEAITAAAEETPQ